MNPIHLYIMSMSGSGTVSGVDRYVDELAQGMSMKPDMRVVLLKFRRDKKHIFIRQEEKNGYVRITVPLPVNLSEIISQPYWMGKYCKHVFELLKEEFQNKERCVLHLNTLNLIDFALYVKSRIPCKIVSHLHCIPWKGLYNTDKNRFNRLFQSYYYRKLYSPSRLYVFRDYEERSYKESDAIVCVTSCARDFLRNLFPVLPPVFVVRNGIRDLGGEKKYTLSSEKEIKCIYAGNMNASKGLHFILRALQLVYEKGRRPRLYIAGACSEDIQVRLKMSYPNIRLDFLGELSLEQLCTFYRKCDLGIIASLQEQCSYVAIEMMMSGLPVVTTDVDGLSEMFVDRYNSLKTKVNFSRVSGLEVDVFQMCRQIVRLIDNPKLRHKMGLHARARFSNCFSSDAMIEDTYCIYCGLFKTNM